MATTRLPNGLTTVVKTSSLGSYILPSPRTVHAFFTDFDTYNAAEWTLVQAGSGSQTLLDRDGGWVRFRNASVEGNHTSLQGVAESFAFESQKEMWFETKMEISNDDTQAVWFTGLYLTNADPINVDPTDGVFFRNKDETKVIEFVSVNDSAETAVDVGSFNADEEFTLGYYYDGNGAFVIFKDKIPITRLTGVDVTTDTLAISLFIENGTGLAMDLNVDYFSVSKGR